MSSVSQPQPAHVDRQGYTAESMEMSQPKAHQPMDAQKPEDGSEPELTLRGGDDCGGWCRGRFCCIIPCPIPINCCIIPL